jgi:EpsI family protein
LELGAASKRATSASLRTVPRALIASTVVLTAAILVSFALPQRVEVQPARSWFVDFPAELGDWRGRQGRIEDEYLDALKLDDYIMADYTNGASVVNLYSAYYASQRQGASVHSPRSCIPGGGWRMTVFGRVELPAEPGVAGLIVNRALIELGGNRQLVYYWFKQRDRELTNEYAAKWYIFVDGLLRSRTDGALVRLTTTLPTGERIEDADARLRELARLVRAEIEPYVPG